MMKFLLYPILKIIKDLFTLNNSFLFSKRIMICCFSFAIIFLAIFVKSISIYADNFTWKKEGKFRIMFYQDIEDDNSYEQSPAIYSYFDWDNDFQFKKLKMNFVLNLEARYEYLKGKDTIEDEDLRLQEAYVRLKGDKFGVIIGRDTVTWGKLDEVAILDILTPQDYSKFVLEDKEERKLPIFMFKFFYYGQDYDAEIVLLPFFKPSYVRFFGSDWSIFDHLGDIIQAGSYPSALKSIIQRIEIVDKDNLDDYSFKNAQIGLRWRSHIENWDYSFYYMYIFNRFPTLEENTIKSNTLKRFLYLPSSENINLLLNTNFKDEDFLLKKAYPRVHLIGADTETTIGDYGLRAELGLFLKSPYLKKDFSYTEKGRLSLGIGVDHTTFNNLYTNLQFIEDVIFDYEELFINKEFTHTLTLNIKKEFLRGKSAIAVDYLYNFSNNEWILQPELICRVGGRLEIILGSFLIGGRQSNIIGRYADKDLAYLGVTYSF